MTYVSKRQLASLPSPRSLLPVDKIMSIEESYRAPEYNAMMPLAAGYFTGEGPWLGNAIKNVAAAAMSPVKPMPTVSKVAAWSGKVSGEGEENCCGWVG